MPEQHLQSSWDVRMVAGEPHAVVRVRKLQTVVQAPQDAWGRQGKVQPLLVSAEVSFHDPFGGAALGDRLGDDTVHYGNLSKAILAALHIFGPDACISENPFDTYSSLWTVFQEVWRSLTGRGLAVSLPGGPTDQTTFLDLRKLQYLSITLHLPKASLLGEGVSLTGSCAYGARSTIPFTVEQSPAMCLRLHNLRVPTLIGVNDIERLNKQLVIATVEIDRCSLRGDVYNALEAAVVKTLDTSSFETLEALGVHLAKTLGQSAILKPAIENGSCNRIRLTLEKPTAVPLAECPAVEILVYNFQ